MATRSQSDFQNSLQYLGVTLIETVVSLEDFSTALVLKINNPNQFTSIIERLGQKLIFKSKNKFIVLANPIIYIDFDLVLDDLNDKKTLQAELSLGFKLTASHVSKVQIPQKEEAKMIKSKQKT